MSGRPGMIAAGRRGTVPAVILGEPSPDIGTEVEEMGYPWPTGRYEVRRRPGPPRGVLAVSVAMPCRCGREWIADGIPSAGGAVQGCGCDYDDEAVAALDRVWSVAVAAAVAAAVAPVANGPGSVRLWS